MPFKVKELPYSYDALEPYIDAQTMKLHHTKHHEAYCQHLNEAIAGTALESLSIEKILARAAEGLPTDVRNNAGGFYNHNLFWNILSPKKNGPMDKTLVEAIQNSFGSIDQFKSLFSKAAEGIFGSGWTWLLLDQGKLKIQTTSNQDSPLMEQKTCLLGLDLWEHAYYLKYQNRRPDYVTAWWNVVNWPQVSENFIAGHR